MFLKLYVCSVDIYESVVNHHNSLQLIGTPSEAELGFLNENAKRYIQQLPPHRRQSLTEKFPHVHPSAIDLVEKMLTFVPTKRITGKLPLLKWSLVWLKKSECL